MRILDEEYVPPIELMDIGEVIEYELEQSIDKRTKDYKEWKKRMNHLIIQYNRISGFKSYALIH